MTLTCTAMRQTALQSILCRELRLSGTLIRRLKYRGAFTINGHPAYTNAPVFPGDTIRVVLDEPPPEIPAESGPLDILYEDDALLAVDKPQGLIVHPTFNRITGTLANRVLGYYAQRGEQSAVHPVTRLDRDTMGVTLFAKNAHIHALLHRDQLAHGLQKTYLALVCGTPPEVCGRIELPIARPDARSIRRCVRADGQDAITEYRVLAQSAGYAVLSLCPVTGRTHQLRVHCAAIGCPIYGDAQYGASAPELPGQLLVAAQLSLSHPLTGKMLTIESAYRGLVWKIAEKKAGLFPKPC